MNRKIKIGLTIIFMSFSCFIFFISFINYYKERNELSKEVKDGNPGNYINYEQGIIELREEYNNNDIVANLKISSSEQSIPVAQTDNNDYYLNHDLLQNEKNTGAIFLDYRVDINTSRKLLIYGHSSKTIDIPFNILEKYYDKNYYEENKYLELITSQEKKKYEIFSVYVETEDFSYMKIDFENEQDYLNHITNLKSKSLYDTGVITSQNDEILILQTCSTHEKYKNYEKKYLLIIARRV